MQSLITYLEIWEKKGRGEARILAGQYLLEDGKKLLSSDILCVVLALLESDMITGLDLRGARFLFELGTEKEDLCLQFFLLMMYAELRKGSIRLGEDPLDEQVSLEGECRSNLQTAVRSLGFRNNRNPEGSPVQHNLFRQLSDNVTAICRKYCAEFLKNRQSGLYTGLIGEKGNARPVIADPDGRGYYFQKYEHCENRILQALKKRLAADKPVSDEKKISRALHEITKTWPLLAGKDMMKLNARQKASLLLSCRSGTLIITGGPGTGKTSVVVQIIRCLRRLMDLRPEEVRLAAPTGRAAMKMQESLNLSLSSLRELYGDNACTEKDLSFGEIQGQTVHRLLGYLPDTMKFRYNRDNPLSARLVIVDETSMMDIALFADLLEAIEPETHLILLGDRNQLPSINAGAVLGDLAGDFYTADDQCPSLSKDFLKLFARIFPDEPELPPQPEQHLLRDHLVVLTRSHRSEKNIRDVCRYINLGQEKKALETMGTKLIMDGEHPFPPDEGCRFIKVDDKEEDLRGVLRAWAAAHYLTPHTSDPDGPSYLETHGTLLRMLEQQEDGTQVLSDACRDKSSELFDLLTGLFRFLEQGQILCFLREGMHGVTGINAVITDTLRPHLTSGPTRDIFSGMPVLVRRNSYSRNLFNGDIGLVLQTGGTASVVFRRQEGFQRVPYSSLPMHQPAFALTVHKSQGSEYDRVLMVLPETESRLMSREILYTGISRARYFAGIVGSEEIFSKCLKNTTDRTSGIAAHMR